MALRKPLVLGANGLPQQLQAGDTLNAAVAGGDQVNLTNGEASPIVIGSPVYVSAANTGRLAQANAAGTSKVRGLVAAVSITNAQAGPVTLNGVLVATTGQWDAVTGGSGGLVPNTTYFLDPATAGKITATPPATVGQLLVSIGTALSTTDLSVEIGAPILL